MVKGRLLQALRYYAMEDVPPGDTRKILHPSNQGWSSGTIQKALDRGFLKVGDGGWHVLSEAGRTALAEAEQVPNRPTP